MDGWIIRDDLSFNWISCWSKWVSNLFTVEYETAYNKDNKSKRISIRRP